MKTRVFLFILFCLLSAVASGCLHGTGGTSFLNTDADTEKQETINGNLPSNNDDDGTAPVVSDDETQVVSQSLYRTEIQIAAGDGGIVKVLGNGSAEYPEAKFTIEPFSLSASSLVTMVITDSTPNGFDELEAVSKKVMITFSNSAHITGPVSLTVKFDSSKLDANEDMLFCYWDGNDLVALPYTRNDLDNTLTVNFKGSSSSSYAPSRASTVLGNFDNFSFDTGNYCLYRFNSTVKTTSVETLYTKNGADFFSASSEKRVLIIGDFLHPDLYTGLVNFLRDNYDTVGILRHPLSSSNSVVAQNLSDLFGTAGDTFTSDIYSLGTGALIARDFLEQKSRYTQCERCIFISPPNNGISMQSYIKTVAHALRIKLDLMTGDFSLLPEFLSEPVAEFRQSYPFAQYLNNYFTSLNSYIFQNSFSTEYHVLTGWSEGLGSERSNGYVPVASTDLRNHSTYVPLLYTYRSFPDVDFSGSPNPDMSYDKMLSDFSYNSAGSYCRKRIYSDEQTQNQPPECTYVSTVGNSENILVSFNLTDVNIDSCTLEFSYYSAMTGWVTTENISDYGKRYAPGAHFITWYSANDIVNRQSDVKVKLTFNDGFGGVGSKESSVFGINNTGTSNYAPVITILSQSGRNRDVTVNYKLQDTNSDDISISFEYSLDDGISYTPVTMTTPSLSSITPADSLSVIWKSEYDIINDFSNMVKIRMRGFDGKIYSSYAISETFPVNNISDGSNDAPMLTIDPVSSGENTIYIYYALDDPEGNACMVEFQYSASDTDSFHTPESGDVVQDLSYIVNGSQIMVSWLSQNNISGRKDNVRIRMRAHDGQTYGSWYTSNYFIVNNP